MTDNQKLKQAAESLINALWKVQDWNTTHVGDCIDKLEKVLAEHLVDDDEPFTEEWLESVGFRYSANDCWLQIGNDDEDCVVEFLLDDAAATGICHCMILESDCGHHIKTRGDVRRLCAALGIELKENEA